VTGLGLGFFSFKVFGLSKTLLRSVDCRMLAVLYNVAYI